MSCVSRSALAAGRGRNEGDDIAIAQLVLGISKLFVHSEANRRQLASERWVQRGQVPSQSCHTSDLRR